MSDAKHTPGPWAVYAQPISSKADAILESIEQVQATENIASHIYLIDAGGKCAAIAGCGPTSEANAHLIAAAPDLLETVHTFQSYGCPVCGGDCGSANPPMMLCPMQMARDAIAKATGSQA